MPALPGEIVAHRDDRPNSGCESGRGGGEAGAACVYRLDAGIGMRSDVSDALLRLVAYSGGTEDGILPMVASGGDAARAAIYFPGGRFICDGDAAAAREGSCAQRDCANHDYAGSGDLRARLAVPRPGVFAGLSQFAVDGFAARGCVEHFGIVDDVDGSAVLGDGFGHVGEIAEKRDCLRTGGSDLGCAGHAMVVVDTSAAMVAVAAGVVRQWRAHLRAAAALVVSDFSVGGIC